MRVPVVAKVLGSLGLVLAAQACVIRETTPVNGGYGYGGYGYSTGPAASVAVGEPSPYSVSSMPPEALYEQMTPSPGYGFVWIDGYWHWNGYEWVWVGGRWERDQAGYVYVQPYYDYVGESYVYTPGYWSRPDRIPRGYTFRDHRDGRPSSYTPPPARATARFNPPGNVAPTPYRQTYPQPATAPRFTPQPMHTQPIQSQPMHTQPMYTPSAPSHSTPSASQHTTTTTPSAHRR